MTIFKRGRICWFHFHFDGRHIQRSTKQGNQRVAREIEAAYRTKLAKGEAGIHEPKRIPAFSDAMEGFLEWSKTEHRAHPLTHRRYRTSSVALLTAFGGRRLDSITPEDIEKFKTRRAGMKGQRTRRLLRPASVNRELACGKALYNHVIKGGVLLENPFRRVKFLAEDNEQTRVLTYEEQQKYLGAASQPLSDIANLMLETGMRPEEVYRLTREHVHQTAGYIFNPYGKTKAAKRRVNLTSRAREVCERRMAEAKGCYLFPHEKSPNHPMLKVNNAHQGAVRRSGVRPFRLYDLRHTFASRAAMAGIDLVTLAAMLGHARIQMVLRYAHPTDRHQAQAVRRLEEFNAAQQIEEFERLKGGAHPLQFPLQ